MRRRGEKERKEEGRVRSRKVERERNTHRSHLDRKSDRLGERA